MPKNKGRGRGRGRGRGQQQPGASGGDHEEMGAHGGPPGAQQQQQEYQQRQQHQPQQQQQEYQQRQQHQPHHQQQRQQEYQEQRQQQPRHQQQHHQQYQQQRQQQPQHQQQYQQQRHQQPQHQQQYQQQRHQQPQHQQQYQQQYQQQQRQEPDRRQQQQQPRSPTPPQEELQPPSPEVSEAADEPEVDAPETTKEPPMEQGAVAATPGDAELVKEFCRKIQIAESNIRRPPNRPDGGGTLGRRIRLVVNHINLNLSSEGQFIFMNDIEVTVVKSSSGKAPAPAPKGKQGGGKQKGDLSKEKLGIVMKQYLFQHPEFRNRFPAYDGNKNVYTNKPLTHPKGQAFDFNVDFDSSGSAAEIRVTVKEAQQINLDVLRGYVARDFRGRDGSTLNMPQDQLRSLTAIFRAGLEAADHMSMGRAIIDKQPSSGMRCGPYDIHDGMFLSVRPQMWTIRLNVDKTQVVLRQKMSLVDFIVGERQARNRGRGNPHEPFNPMEIRDFTKKLRGMRVVGDHYMSAGKRYSRKFTIQSLSQRSAADEIIRDLNQSVARYHEETYRMRLQYPHWPCICTNREKKTLAPIELFALVPFQRAPNDNPDITREIIRHAAIKPHDRRGRIERMVQNLKTDKTIQTFLSKYLINIDPRLLQTEGRVLPPPVILYDGQQVPIRDNQAGAWRADRCRFSNPVTIEEIYVANFSRNDASRGISTLLNFGGSVGMTLPQFNPGFMENNLRWSEREMRRIFEDCSKYWKDKLDRCMLIVILPFEDAAYGIIKRFGDDEFGVPTQCIKDRTLGKMNGQTATNILLKMNAKLNGVNWRVRGVSEEVTFRPIMEPFIVFGADVTHPSPTGNRKLQRSIAAVVASMDKGCTLYKSEISIQESTRGEGSTAVVELIQDLKNMVQRLLRKFYQQSRVKPRRIFFYRDGVSEGQFRDVIDREVASIQEACMALDREYQPGITFIVVQKRHHTRLFPMNQGDSTRSGNVPAGTIVDKDIVHPREFDFFLCSHDGIQGTSKPCHYHVLWDDNKWSSNDLQLFTYYLCHCYARCTRSVSYPAPTYYSHLAAFRAREVHGDLVDGSDSGSVVSGDDRAAAAVGPKNTTPRLDKQYWM